MYIIKYPRSPLTDAIPSFLGTITRHGLHRSQSIELILALDTKSEATINFGEFTEVNMWIDKLKTT